MKIFKLEKTVADELGDTIVTKGVTIEGTEENATITNWTKIKAKVNPNAVGPEGNIELYERDNAASSQGSIVFNEQDNATSPQGHIAFNEHGYATSSQSNAVFNNRDNPARLIRAHTWAPEGQMVLNKHYNRARPEGHIVFNEHNDPMRPQGNIINDQSNGTMRVSDPHPTLPRTLNESNDEKTINNCIVNNLIVNNTNNWILIEIQPESTLRDFIIVAFVCVVIVFFYHAVFHV